MFYPQNALLSFSLCIPLESWTVLMGYTCKSNFKITEKKPVRIMSNSEYLTHSKPLFKTLKLLKIDDVYKLKLMKFYYHISIITWR